MTIGNWRSHILIKCAVCSKLMGHHKPSTTATCVDCEIQEQIKKKQLIESFITSVEDKPSPNATHWQRLRRDYPAIERTK